MPYKPSTSEERARFLSPFLRFAVAFLWVDVLLMSLSVLWGGPILFGLVMYIPVFAITLDAGKNSLGSHARIFSRAARMLPRHQKLMFAGLAMSTLVNGHSLYGLMR